MTARCDDHAGEPYPPRCAACDALNENANTPTPDQVREQIDAFMNRPKRAPLTRKRNRR